MSWTPKNTKEIKDIKRYKRMKIAFFIVSMFCSFKYVHE